MKRLRWQFLVLLLALIAIGALLLSQQQAALPGVEPVNEPIPGGIYSEALIGSLGRLNPILDSFNSVDSDVDRLIFSSLVKFDSRGLPHGDLAESWGISQDGKVYNFSINPNAVWHDGQPVTSDDIIFTANWLSNDELPVPKDIRTFWKQVEMKALNDKTLQIRLPEPFSPFLDFLTFGIIPKHLLDGLSPSQLMDAPFNIQPIGSGPFRFRGLNIENGKITGVVLDAFQDYYQRKPFIDQFVIRYYPDVATALAALEKGEAMGISQVTPEFLPQALKEVGLNLYTGRLPRLSLIYLNLDNPKMPYFQDQIVRRALMMSINRRWMIDHLMGGQGIIADSPIFPENWAYYEGIESIEYSPETAISLLRKAGYTFPSEGGQVRAKDGVPLSFELVFPEGELYSAIAEQVRKDWERLGVQATLKAVPYNELLDKYLEPRTYEAALVQLDFTRSPDPDPYPFWHQSQINGGQNYAQWDDRQVSEYLEQARVLDDYFERVKRYRNFQVRFASELPALLLFYPVYTYGVNEQVRGVSIGPIYDPSDRFSNVTSWYLLTGSSAQVTPTSPPGNQ